MDKLNNLLAQVAVLGNAQRQYQLECAEFGSNVVERWWGRDALSAHAATEVDVLSTDQYIDLEALLAKQAALLIRTADGGEQRRSGLIASAQRMGSDGGLVRYRLSLRSWTWWLQHARHSRVFQDSNVRQILDAVLQDYPDLANWRWAEGCNEFIASRVRSYCVQYRESDLDFLQRLLAEEGLGWRLYPDEQAPCGSGMEIFADSLTLPEDAASAKVGVRFHRSDATESSDSIQALGRHRALGSNRISLLSDDYRSVRGIAAQLPLDGGGEQSQRESYDPVGAYAFSNAAAADWYAKLQAQAHEVHARTWLGQGTVRGFQSGTWLQVLQAPFSAAPELLLTEVDHAGINNLPTDVRQAMDDALGKAPIDAADAALWQQAEKVGYANRFKATERAMPWRPVLVDGTGQRLNPRPTAPGYQTARVVASHGGKGQDVHADSMGRIRVCFHFQNGEADTTWLRVAQRYAGPGVGAQFLPRIGQEVLVGFLDGDIDRPIVLGALYNGRGEAGIAPTATEDVMEMHRDRYQTADRGASVVAWTSAVRRDEAEVVAARARGDSQLVVDAYERVVLKSKEELKIARNRRIHNFGSPGELATESGTGRLAVRALLGGNVISLVSYVNSEEGNPLREEAMAKIRRDIKRMRLRAPGEVPDEPGVCFPGLFFADDGTTDYHAHASFRYVDRPNVAYSIDTGYRPAPEQGEGIAKHPISNWRQVLAYPGVLLTMPADDVQRRDVVKPGGILAGGLSFDKTGIAITREGDTKRDPGVRTYQLYAGMPGIEGVQAMPFVSMTMQGWSQQTYPQLKQQPPPLEESEKRFDAILHNLHLRHTTPEMPDYERLLGKQTASPE